MRLPALVVLTGTGLLFTAGCFGAPFADDQLSAVLTRMDETSATFKGLTADIKKIAHTEVINADQIDTGTFTVKRVGRGKELQMLLDLKEPDAKKILVTGTKAQEYILKNPTEVQEYDLGRKFRGMFDQFLLLGFGSNSAELRSAYTVKLGQPATDMVAGEKTTKILLVPKSEEMRQHIKQCELWISDARGITVQQKFYTGGGDYHLVTYTNIAINPKIGDLTLNLPHGVKTVKPLKD